MPKVSVIIPVYNVEQYLRECLDSVVNQTLKDIEIICVNDCSKDNSIEIVKKYAQKDSRIKIIEHDKNQGLGATRNTGIINANGEYIFFLDSDDYISLDILENLYEKSLNTNADIICTDTEVFAYGEKTSNVIEKTQSLKNYFSSKNFIQNININSENFDNGYENFSVVAWGKLFSTDFIKKNKLFFIKEKVAHEDDGFWIKTLSCFPRISTLNKIGVYYRIHSNSIVTNMKKGRNNNDLRKALLDSFDYIHNKQEIIKNKQTIISKIKKSNSYYMCFGIEISPLIKIYWGKNNRVIKLLGISLYKKQIRRNHLITKVLDIKINKKPYKSVNADFKEFIQTCEVQQNKIVFNNFSGKGYGCNPKYIAEEIIKQNLPYELVWLVNDIEKEKDKFPEQIKLVQNNIYNAIRELASAKIWISNQRMPYLYENGLYKKSNQYYIQTWHGWALKKIEKDIEASKGWWCKWAKIDSQNMDLLLAACKEDRKNLVNNFYFDGEILDCGFPRNDIFYLSEEEQKKLKNKIYNHYSISKDKKIIFYAPTFRDDYRMDAYKFNAEMLLQNLKQKFNEEFVLLVRLHPNVQSQSKKIFKYSDKVIDATLYPDIQELLAISDILLTDYSSCMLDYMLTLKPIFIFAKDFVKYTSERDFYIDFQELPFPLAKTENDLIKNIQAFDQNTYQKAIKCFMKICNYNKPSATREIIQKINNTVINKELVHE